MNAAVGFTSLWQGSSQQKKRTDEALDRALDHFPEMKQETHQIGDSTLTLWGRGNLDACVHTLPDGSVLALVGSPLGNVSWQTMETALSGGGDLAGFRPPWDGRFVLLHISGDGRLWRLWNDWLGSIPVFYSNASHIRVASTLEPAVVAANRFGSEDIFLPGLLFMLMQGNFIADWTLFKNMRTIRPDSATTIDEHGCHTAARESVPASEAHCDVGWNDLIEEMHALVEKAILDTLKTQPAWIVPISSGLDSRLIAAVGASAGIPMQTYTWGPATTRDTVYSRQISQALGLPWQRIDLGDDYLARYLPVWVDLFGSAMHFHGMYQIPFLEALKTAPAAPIISGFIGECLAGYDVRFQTEMHRPGERHYYVHPPGYRHWDIQDLKCLFRFPIDDALEQIADVIEEEKNAVSGPWFQKLRFLTMWGRQNHFTYFNTLLSDYWRGVSAPYINLDYARFCLSLSRVALDDRRLQIDMMRRYYPRIMNIAGTYAPEPAILTGSYLLKRRVAKKMPTALVRRLLPEFAATNNIKTDITSLRACGKKATWPIQEHAARLGQWIDMGMIEKTYDQAVAGEIDAVRRLQSIQVLAYRLGGG